VNFTVPVSHVVGRRPYDSGVFTRYILNFYDVLKIVKIVCANTFYILYIFIFYIYFIHTYICYFIYVYIVTVFSLISGICSSVTELIPNRIRFLPCDAMHSAAIAVTRCLSVCPSVTFVSYAKTNKDIIEIFSPCGSQAILVFPYQTGWHYSNGNPLTGASNARGGV